VRFIRVLILFCVMWLAADYCLSHITYTDPQLLNMVRSFDLEARQHFIADTDTSRVSVMFGNPDAPAVGECRIYSNRRVIVILRAAWDKYDSFKREELIFHELGHCVLNRKHCNYQDEHGYISIMNESLLSSDYYEENRDDLLEELFHANTRCK
jgi:hypothetical protein